MTELEFSSEMDVQVFGHYGSDEQIAQVARTSLAKELVPFNDVERLVPHLVREGHNTTYEHNLTSFRMDVPIFVHRQIMTHRHLTKNTESGRYVQLRPKFYIPSEDRPMVNEGTSARPKMVKGEGYHNEVLEDVQSDLAQRAWDQYEYLLGIGVAKESARAHLPVNQYTSCIVSGNLNAWFNFMAKRGGYVGHPQEEIVQVAKKVEEAIANFYPLAYGAWKTRMLKP